MADGSLKNIQEIKPGDRVASYDFKTDNQAVSEVTRIVPINVASYLIINNLKVTEHHPFAIGQDKWVAAGDLRAGDKVVGMNSEIVVREISTVKEMVDVYDLTVSSYANFYVFDGDSFFLVHNKD